jgi:hypothetical protein
LGSLQSQLRPTNMRERNKKEGLLFPQPHEPDAMAPSFWELGVFGLFGSGPPFGVTQKEGLLLGKGGPPFGVTQMESLLVGSLPQCGTLPNYARNASIYLLALARSFLHRLQPPPSPPSSSSLSPPGGGPSSAPAPPFHPFRSSTAPAFVPWRCVNDDRRGQ